MLDADIVTYDTPYAYRHAIHSCLAPDYYDATPSHYADTLRHLRAFAVDTTYAIGYILRHAMIL